MKNIKINKQSIKDAVLLIYVVVTALGVYSATIFYAGTQYASAQNASGTVHASASKTNSPK